MKKFELPFLKKIHLIILILTGIIMPTITGTAAYFSLKLKIEEKDRVVSEKLSDAILATQKNFVTKEEFQRTSDKVDRIDNNVTEIKTLLQPRRR